jgi:hypothetical protein
MAKRPSKSNKRRAAKRPAKQPKKRRRASRKERPSWDTALALAKVAVEATAKLGTYRPRIVDFAANAAIANDRGLTELSHEQWQKIDAALKAHLPAANREYVRRELDRIINDWGSPQQRRDKCLRQIAAFQDALLRSRLSEQDATLLKQLILQEQTNVEAFQRAINRRETAKFMRQCDVLMLWQSIGGSLSIATPRKRVGEHKRPKPYGPVVSFLQAVIEAFDGEALGADRIKQVVQRYRRLKFHVVKAGEVDLAVHAGFEIDDGKVFILRGAHR